MEMKVHVNALTFVDELRAERSWTSLELVALGTTQEYLGVRTVAYILLRRYKPDNATDRSKGDLRTDGYG